MLGQLCPLVCNIPFKAKIVLPNLPPALIVGACSLPLLYMCTGHYLILDPYCRVEDSDLEIMRHQPNIIVSLSVLGLAILNSKRIPDDLQMPMLIGFGSGAEPANNKNIRLFDAWLKKHGAVHARYTMGYGQTEAGASLTDGTIPFCNAYDVKAGIPMPHNVIGIFNDDDEELDFNEFGEICARGPSIMLGYGDEKATAKTLKVHADGKRWLHTGDYGFMNEEGEVTILSRGVDKTWMGGNLYLMAMENKIIEIPGIKDAFFVSVPDKQHDGYKVPHLFLVPEEGAELSSIEAAMKQALEPHEYPVQIHLIEKRPFFHYKTDRIRLVRKIVAGTL